MYQLFDSLSERRLGDGRVTGTPVVIGLGSGHGDDSAGWMVVDRLRSAGWPDDQARSAVHPSDLLDWCAPDRPLVLCDACEGSGPVGTLRCWRWPDAAWPLPPMRGTHDLPLPAVLELGRITGRLPPEVTVWTIEGRDWAPHADVSPAVAEAAVTLAATITRAFRDA